MICDHYHTDPIRCWTCIARFFRWASAHSNSKGGRRKRKDGTEKVVTALSFYEAAAKSYSEIHCGGDSVVVLHGSL